MGFEEKIAAREELEKMQLELTKLSVRQEQIEKEEEKEKGEKEKPAWIAHYRPHWAEKGKHFDPWLEGCERNYYD